MMTGACRTASHNAPRHGRSRAVRATMLLVLAILFAVAWIFGFTVFHVASATIHILLIVAIVSLIAHFVRGAAARPRS